MLKAGEAADSILEASDKEILGMMIQEGKDSIDEKQEEEKAEEASEKREEQQERIDEAKEKGVTEISLDATDLGRPLYEALGFCASNECMVMSI